MNEPNIEDLTSDLSWRIRHAVDRTYFDQLTRIMVVMFSYYSFITVAHYFFLTEPARTPLMFSSILTALASATVYVLTRYKAIRPSQGHIAFVVPGVFGMIAVYLHVFLTGDQLQLTNGVLILFGFGIITLLPQVYYSFFILSSALFLSMLILVPGPFTAHMAFMYIAAAALSILCFQIRYRTLINLERLLVSNRHKTTQMVTLSRDLQAKMEEANQAAEAAEAANAAKDAFLANTTHELKTPLTGVLGMMDLLEDMQLSGAQRDAVAAARFSAQTLLVIVNDLLDLAKMDSGQMEIRSVPFSPNLVIEHVCDLLRPAADNKGLTLQYHHMAQGASALVGDPVRIAQIVLNLLDNAIKFTEKGGVDVYLEVAESDDQGDLPEAHVVVRVKDSGVGIQPGDWMRIFNRFEQLDSSSTRQAEGAGLGLSVCEGLARRMGGQMSVESEPNTGTEFAVTLALPIAENIENVDLSFVSRPKEATTTRRPDPVAFVQNQQLEPASVTVNAQGYNILLAEDNLVNQLLVRKLADKFGWNLTVVPDGEQAVLALAQDKSFDLVLMDIRMPVLDGIGATEAIKKAGGDQADIPIVALTANAGEEESKSYLAAGMVEVVSKPINADILNNTVDRILKVRAMPVTS